MERPPRRPESPLFSRALVGWSVLQGGLALAATGGLTWHFWQSGMAEDSLRSAAFFALVLAIASLILVNRRYSASLVSALGRANPALAMVLGVVSVILLATQLIAPIATLFRFAPLAGTTVLTALAVCAALFVVLERLKPKWSGQLSR